MVPWERIEQAQCDHCWNLRKRVSRKQLSASSLSGPLLGCRPSHDWDGLNWARADGVDSHFRPKFAALARMRMTEVAFGSVSDSFSAASRILERPERVYVMIQYLFIYHSRFNLLNQKPWKPPSRENAQNRLKTGKIGHNFFPRRYKVEK